MKHRQPFFSGCAGGLYCGITPPLLCNSPFLSTETFSTVSGSTPVTHYKSGKIWTSRFIRPTDSVVVSRGGGNKSTTMGGLDVLPHGQFLLHVPVLILEFGSEGRNNGVRDSALIGLWESRLQSNIWVVSRRGGKQTWGGVKAEDIRG